MPKIEVERKFSQDISPSESDRETILCPPTSTDISTNIKRPCSDLVKIAYAEMITQSVEQKQRAVRDLPTFNDVQRLFFVGCIFF